MRISIWCAAALAMLAPAAAPLGAAPQARKPVPEAKPIGEPVNCIPIAQIRSSEVRSDQVIDFRMAGGKTYRNTLPQSCPQLGFEKRFAYQTSISQLCSVDIVTVLLTTGPGLQRGASCGLGQFQQVELPKRGR